MNCFMFVNIFCVEKTINIFLALEKFIGRI